MFSYCHSDTVVYCKGEWKNIYHEWPIYIMNDFSPRFWRLYPIPLMVSFRVSLECSQAARELTKVSLDAFMAELTLLFANTEIAWLVISSRPAMSLSIMLSSPFPLPILQNPGRNVSKFKLSWYDFPNNEKAYEMSCIPNWNSIRRKIESMNTISWNEGNHSNCTSY